MTERRPLFKSPVDVASRERADARVIVDYLLLLLGGGSRGTKVGSSKESLNCVS